MKFIYSYMVLLALALCFNACYKDKGNYDYHPINELSFQNFDTANGYNVYSGQTLSIAPSIKGTLDPDGTKHNYSYEWSLDFPVSDSVISTEKALSMKVTLTPGTYTLQYKVIDKETGVQFRTSTRLLVTTTIFEGYMVLSEVNGASRLDMLSYSRAGGAFTKHIDVLNEMGSALPAQGKPIQVFCMDKNMPVATTPESYRIYILTETGTNWVDAETFGYTEFNNIRYEMTGDLPSGFAPSHMTGELLFGLFPAMVLTAGNNVFTRLSDAPNFAYAPANIYSGASQPFKAFPTTITNGFTVVMFNMDKRTFTSTGLFGTSAADMAPGLNYPSGKELVHMEYNNSGYAYAVLKDPNSTNYYMLRFTPGEAVSYFEPIIAPDIDKATQFAVSPQLGYLFYSAGGKLYEYDLFLKQSFLMLNKGTSIISHLSFQKFINSNANYNEWAKLLTVGSYEPGVAEGSNGKMELYNIPPINGQITISASWTGLGRVKSVSFRERP